MKKGLNRSEDHKPDHSLPRSKILRGRRNFQRLFEKSTVLTSDSIQFRYRLYDDPSEGRYVGFIAPKKIIKSAVKRNMAKRLMREVYRTHQEFLNDLFTKEAFGFHGAFLVRKIGLTFDEVKEDMPPLLQKVRERLMNVENRHSKKDPLAGKTPNKETK